MRKSNGVIGRLSQAQQDLLERWLFDESPTLTYPQAKERCLEEFKIEVGVWSLGSFYQRRARVRLLARVAELGRAGNPGWGPVSAERDGVFEALLEVVGRMAFDVPAESEEKLPLKELKELARVATMGLRAKREADMAEHRREMRRVREREAGIKDRGVALRERMYEDKVNPKPPVRREGGLSEEAQEEIRRTLKLF